MKVAILFSGGKDSNFALFLASKKHEIKCLITLKSENQESYMFQTPGTDFVNLQAKCLEIPLIEQETKGIKEEELKDLELGILRAKKKFGVEGVVSGAIKSTYQSTRIQKICHKLNLWSLNPLWQIDEEIYLMELLKNNFEIKLIAIASYPLDERYLNKTINSSLKENLSELKNKYKISSIGEGGEFESFVIDSPMFRKKLKIEKFEKVMDGENCGKLIIKAVKLVKK